MVTDATLFETHHRILPVAPIPSYDSNSFQREQQRQIIHTMSTQTSCIFSSTLLQPTIHVSMHLLGIISCIMPNCRLNLYYIQYGKSISSDDHRNNCCSIICRNIAVCQQRLFWRCENWNFCRNDREWFSGIRLRSFSFDVAMNGK